MNEFEKLEKRINDLEQALNTNAISSFMQALVKDTPEVVDADVELSQTVGVSGGGGGSVTISTVDYPDRWLVIRYQGELYRVPAYLERLDSSR